MIIYNQKLRCQIRSAFCSGRDVRQVRFVTDTGECDAFMCRECKRAVEGLYVYNARTKTDNAGAIPEEYIDAYEMLRDEYHMGKSDAMQYISGVVEEKTIPIRNGIKKEMFYAHVNAEWPE